MSSVAQLHDNEHACRLAGRVSMDLLTVDITDLPETPEHLDILGPYQTVDTLAEAAATIGYEILTSLGNRYQRRYIGA
jgi:alanine racemase